MTKKEWVDLLIPSKAIREAIMNSDFEFNDVDKVDILVDGYIGSNISIEKYYLPIIAESTENIKLKEAITEYISNIEKALELLKDNNNGEYFYLVKYNFEDMENIQVFCRTFDEACAVGRLTKQWFTIEKHSFSKPEDFSNIEDIFDISSECIGNVGYNISGDMTYISYDEIDTCFYIESFRDQFHFDQMPYPFERGDSIFFRKNGSIHYAILEVSEEDFRRVNDPYIRYVELFDDDVKFYHEHIPVYMLEKYEIDGFKLSCNSLEEARNDLLLEASLIYKGKGSFEELWMFQSEYRKFIKE